MDNDRGNVTIVINTCKSLQRKENKRNGIAERL